MCSAITCTCKVCGKAFVRDVPEGFWTETPSKRWRCPECKGKKGLEPKKKKRKMTPEQIEAFKERMRKYREENQK